MVRQARFGDLTNDPDSLGICNATHAIERLCNRKLTCLVMASPSDLCGADPAPDQPEEIEIYYSCGKTSERYTYALKDQVARLSCTGIHQAGTAKF